MVVFAAASFISLQKQYPMLTPVILKAALALMVILHTHTHALFLNPEAQRARFSFIGENPPLKSIPEAAN